MFHDIVYNCLNVCGSSMPYCSSRSLPRALHNWKGMVVGFLSGQIFNWLTHILVMSLCYSQALWSLCDEGKHIVSRLWMLAVWTLIKDLHVGLSTAITQNCIGNLQLICIAVWHMQKFVIFYLTKSLLGYCSFRAQLWRHGAPPAQPV